MRRALLAGVLALGVQGALAQEAAPAPEASATVTAPRATPAPRRARVPAAVKPRPMEIAKLPPQLQAARRPDAQAGIRAPVPNRNLDAPLVIPQDRTRLGPSIINRNLPGRGQAAEGAPNLLEDKLFRPAPGARLNVPFSF